MQQAGLEQVEVLTLNCVQFALLACSMCLTIGAVGSAVTLAGALRWGVRGAGVLQSRGLSYHNMMVKQAGAPAWGPLQKSTLRLGPTLRLEASPFSPRPPSHITLHLRVGDGAAGCRSAGYACG